MINYIISPQCTAPDGSALCLSVQKQTNQLVVWNRLPGTDPSQLWAVSSLFDANGAEGLVLVNLLTDMAILSPSDWQAVTLMALSPQMIGQRCSWNIFSGSTNYGAVQLAQNNDMNLNVQGDGPYPNGTPVLAYGDYDGDANEIWIFTPIFS